MLAHHNPSVQANAGRMKCHTVWRRGSAITVRRKERMSVLGRGGRSGRSGDQGYAGGIFEGGVRLAGAQGVCLPSFELEFFGEQFLDGVGGLADAARTVAG